MMRSEITAAWLEIESATHAACFLLQWADCDGPLAHLPTSDPAIQLLLNARRHLLHKARTARKDLYS